MASRCKYVVAFLLFSYKLFLYCAFQDTNSVIYLAELEFLIRVSSKATTDLLVSSGQKLKLS